MIQTTASVSKVMSLGFDPDDSWVSIPIIAVGVSIPRSRGFDPYQRHPSGFRSHSGYTSFVVSACGVGVIMYGSQLCDPGSNPGWRIVLYRSLDGRVV